MATIARVSARPIPDSRGERTIKVTLTLADKTRVTASVPHGKSEGSHEAKAVSAERAVRNIEKIILPALKGKSVTSQRAIDKLLCKLDGTRDKRRLGGNATLAVSVAAARAAALSRGIPLWRYLRALGGLRVQHMRRGIIYPRLYINVINGGLHADNNLDFQEYLVIPRARTFRDSAAIGTRVYRALGKYLAREKGRRALRLGDEGGFALDFEDNEEPFRVLRRVVTSLRLRARVDFGLDAAANGVSMRCEKLAALYRRVAQGFPLIYLEDPFGEEAFLEFAALRRTLGSRMMVAGDDLTTTNVRRMRKAHTNRSVNAVIVKPNQIGTVSEALDAVRLARTYGWAVVVSHRSGETDDDFIADFAYGAGADGFKLGTPVRRERMVKYRRLLRIEKGDA